MQRKTVALATVLLACGAASDAHAFCGFYVTGAEASLFEDATTVVLMRDGTRTVLSMQNDYRGPPQDFAMVVPVPTVLSEDNVRTLDRSVFTHVDQLAAPRLVEYWEQDPCRILPPMRSRARRSGGGIDDMLAGALGGSSDLGVRVEAQFAVAEYDIVILSASDSSGLDTWLRREGYRIPNGAEAVLRPYVEAGTKFFVARIDVDRVTFQDGRALLSPLRVHYDTPEFNLPIRLGLLNSAGQQDLIVHILARQRYEVANHPNALIPTNIEVRNGVRRRFGEFYNALFDRTLAQHPGAVITEYSWAATSCDPCPTPPLTPTDLATLGADVIGGGAGFTLTRLHYRYTSATLGDDLVFRATTPIVGGRGVPDESGRMDQSTQPTSYDNFQGRYAILHRWTGPMTCEHPNRGDWGGPPHGGVRPNAQAATGLAYAPRRMELDRMVRVPVPALGLRPRRATTGTTTGTGGGGPPPESPHAALEPRHEGRGVALFLAGLAAGAIVLRRFRS